MKKKLMALVFAVAAVFGLSGCGGGGDSVIVDGGGSTPNETTLFLVDEVGNSYGDIPYKCDSMRDWKLTLPNGEFTFLPPDNCQFDFTGLNGDNGHGFIDDDIVRIVDDLDSGKGSVPYECNSFGASTTFGDGSFYYDIDDQCTFYL